MVNLVHYKRIVHKIIAHVPFLLCLPPGSTGEQQLSRPSLPPIAPPSLLLLQALLVDHVLFMYPAAGASGSCNYTAETVPNHKQHYAVEALLKDTPGIRTRLY